MHNSKWGGLPTSLGSMAQNEHKQLFSSPFTRVNGCKLTLWSVTCNGSQTSFSCPLARGEGYQLRIESMTLTGLKLLLSCPIGSEEGTHPGTRQWLQMVPNDLSRAISKGECSQPQLWSRKANRPKWLFSSPLAGGRVCQLRLKVHDSKWSQITLLKPISKGR